VLRKEEYLGQYGKILKIIINKNNFYTPKSNKSSFSAFVTFSNAIEASVAVLVITNFNNTHS